MRVSTIRIPYLKQIEFKDGFEKNAIYEGTDLQLHTPTPNVNSSCNESNIFLRKIFKIRISVKLTKHLSFAHTCANKNSVTTSH
jgi:hypothetical protein